jgi:hypothetical protein
MILPDANILLYAVNEASDQHGLAIVKRRLGSSITTNTYARRNVAVTKKSHAIIPRACGCRKADRSSIRGGCQAHSERHIANCTKADSAYGAGVAQALARMGQTSSADDRKIV